MGLSKAMPSAAIIEAWDKPMPSVKGLLHALATVSAWPAKVIGWRGKVGMMAVPSSIA